MQNQNNKTADGSYYDGKFETIEYIEHVVDALVKNGLEPKRAYCVGQALKYLSSRLGAKSDTPVELDLQKAENYVHRALWGEWIDPEFLWKPGTPQEPKKPKWHGRRAMAKITIELEEVTEPQVFKTPERMLVWSLREGKACDFCVRDVVAILPPLPNHANVVCLNGESLWWATHCAKLPTT